MLKKYSFRPKKYNKMLFKTVVATQLHQIGRKKSTALNRCMTNEFLYCIAHH